MIEAGPLRQIPGIRHGFFTREGGHSAGLYASLNCGYGSGDDKSVVRRNRADVARRMEVDRDRLVTVWQSHSTEVKLVESPWDPLAPPEADAMVTAKPGIAIGVLTADCAPVLFASADGRIVGAAHAGWKGALDGVIEATVRELERLGAKREGLHAAIGPAIGAENYEVGPEFFARFTAADRGNERFFRPSDRIGHHFFDLPAYVRTRLERLGLAAVADLGLCTYAEQERFFSYRRTTHRREKDYGRQISAIAIM